MATDPAAPMKQDLDAGNATLERKRPYNVIISDDASNAGSAHSNPRKRSKTTGKLGHQDVRDFVPVGATFSTSVVPIEEAQDIGDDGSEVDMDPESEVLSGYGSLGVSGTDGPEQQKALVEGRRLLIKDLPPNTTEEHLNQFFKGYSIENIQLPDRMCDNPQEDTNAQKERLTTDRGSSGISPVEEAANIGTKDGCRLYVGNLSYAATVEDLRAFFSGFTIENVIIPVKPRTGRPVGYAFVTVSTSDEADRAMSQLSGNELLERKVSLHRARAEDTKALDSVNTLVEEVTSATKDELVEGYRGYRNVKIEGEPEESKMLHEVSEQLSPQSVLAAPPVSWNAANTTKIRTTLGGSVGKVKDLGDEPTLTNGKGKENEALLTQDMATSVALERVKALRFRFSSMNPHDGPVSAYKAARQEVHDAEVNYNYCLYSPADEVFQSPPLAIEHESTIKKKDGMEYRLRLWSMVEQCMKEGTLQNLKEGKIRVGSTERSDQPSPEQSEVDGQEDLQSSIVTDPEQVQVFEAQEMDNKQHNNLKSLRNMKLGSQKYENMKKRIQRREISLNYCKYFPTTEGYLSFTLAIKGLKAMNSSKIDGIRGIERRAAQILKLVEQCTQDGMLQDLKDGRLAAWLKDAPPPNQSFLASALQVKRPQGITARESKRPYCGGPKVASIGDADATSADVKLISNEEGLSNHGQDVSESDKGVILNLDYGSRDMPSGREDGDARPATKPEDKDENSISDAEVNDILNSAADDINANDSRMASNSDTESNNSSMDSEGQSEDEDPLMQYSNSEQLIADEGERNGTTVAQPPSQSASILADLSTHDLNAQLRYFHTTKAREEVDGKTPVRCLVCAKEGHMASFCESLTCSNCGAFNRHTTQACPNNAKCGKCREQGHDEGHCPYKLKRLPGHEIVCDLCQRNGHIEDDCELVWRTSGRPWDSDLAHANVRLSCYECGHSGHLGNDCPSRKPDKAKGTSTWDGNMGPVSIKSTREIKIKGKATRQDTINLDDSDDERANFYRPKMSLPEPVRRGQIRIVTGRHESPMYEPSRDDRPAYADHQNDSFTLINDTYRSHDARQPHQEYRDRGRGSWRAVDGPDYTAGYDNVRYNDHRSNERRSRSPPYQDHKGYAGADSWPPSRPGPRAEQQDRRPRTDANVYRPMPSAAQNAWARRRL